MNMDDGDGDGEWLVLNSNHFSYRYADLLI